MAGQNCRERAGSRGEPRARSAGRRGGVETGGFDGSPAHGGDAALVEDVVVIGHDAGREVEGPGQLHLAGRAARPARTSGPSHRRRVRVRPGRAGGSGGRQRAPGSGRAGAVHGRIPRTTFRRSSRTSASRCPSARVGVASRTGGRAPVLRRARALRFSRKPRGQRTPWKKKKKNRGSASPPGQASAGSWRGRVLLAHNKRKHRAEVSHVVTYLTRSLLSERVASAPRDRGQVPSGLDVWAVPRAAWVGARLDGERETISAARRFGEHGAGRGVEGGGGG